MAAALANLVRSESLLVEISMVPKWQIYLRVDNAFFRLKVTRDDIDTWSLDTLIIY